jgi:hypothetical protein
MQKWQYKTIVEHYNSLIPILNQEDSCGWELVSVVPYAEKQYWFAMFLKRLLPPIPVTNEVKVYPSHIKYISFHDDPPCHAEILPDGKCSICGYVPDMQSLRFIENPNYIIEEPKKVKALKCKWCKQEFPNSWTMNVEHLDCEKAPDFWKQRHYPDGQKI